MPTALVGLKINTLGSVDKAANGHALVSLMKRAPETAPTPTIDIAKVMTETIAKASTMQAVDLNTILLNRALDDILWELTRALDSSLESIIMDPTLVDKDTAVSTVLAQFYTALVSSGVTSMGMVSLGKRVDEKASTIAKPILKSLLSEADIYIGKKELQGGKNMPTEEEIAKRAAEFETIQKRNAELEVMFAKAEADRVNAENILKAERDEASKQMFIAKAGEYKSLPVTAADFGVVLKGMFEKAPEEYVAIEALLKAADAAISKGGIFAETGTTGGGQEGGQSALQMLDAIADGMVTKGENGLSKAQAFTKALEQNPALYIQYEQEQNARGDE